MSSDNQYPLWQPTSDNADASQLASFLREFCPVEGSGTYYAKAHNWSVENPEDFWASVWDFAEIKGDKGENILVSGDDMLGARFFPEAKLNFAENLLARDSEDIAIIATGEGRERREMSWGELRKCVAKLQAWLKSVGVGEGDRVAAVMPNAPETIIAMLAASSLGAAFSSCSPDFGEQGILDRFGQIEPKVVVACNGYFYGGKTFDIRPKVEAVLVQLPSVSKTIWVDYTGLGASDGDDGIDWSDIQAGPNVEMTFEKFAFSIPLYIMFSSGTTGKPKCIVHSAGGTLIQHLKEHKLHADVKPGDRVFYFTTCGWMMWNWLVSALASEATLLLYDGNPFYPDANTLFAFAAEEKASFFGVSAKYIDAVKKDGFRPGDTNDLSSVRTIASTGSPLAPESFDFVYDAIKKDVNLASISGGTDIVSCFVLGNPTLPVWRGEIQCAGLGMDVEIWDDDGKPIVGDRGELVCTKPFPSMPVGFWNDPDGARYKAAYFEKYDNIWCHGDFGIETEHGGYVIVGRSDATLNPGGVRIGTAEIYRQVEQIDDVIESIAVGQEWQDDVRVVLFVILRDGTILSDELVAEIKSRIRKGASPRHVPQKVIAVADIPRTKSGKITELAVRDVIHGKEIKNTEALANPESLESYKDLPELKV